MAKKKVLETVVKRGRKSKRGRPKTKKEVVKKIVKKQDPFKVKKLSGESDAAYKKRKALINKLKNQSIKETAKDSGKKLPTTKDRTSRSMTIPLKRKEQSKAAFRRRVMQGLQGVTKKGESKDIGKAGYPVSETMRELGYTGSRKAKVDLTDKELEALGFQIKKAGGSLIKAKNGSGKDFLVPEKIRKNIPYYLNKLKKKKKKKLPKKLSVTVAKNGGKIENKKKKKITFKKIKKATKDVITDRISGAKKNIKDIFKGTSLKPSSTKFYKAGGLIDPPNPGAAALPRPVRNQMGFKKRGGKIKRLAVGGGIALKGLGATRKK